MAAIRKQEVGYTWRFQLLKDILFKGFSEGINFSAQMQLSLMHDSSLGGVMLASLQQGVQLGIERLFETLNHLLQYGQIFADLFAYTNRLYELHQELERMEAPEMKAAGVAPRIQGEDIWFHNLDLLTPSGHRLASGLDVRVRRHESLMVTGPNACGKTSLIRVLGGLWPAQAANGTTMGDRVGAFLARPASGTDGTTTIQDLFLVPQRPYMCEGTLSQQVTYPQRPPPTPELHARLQSLLEAVGIGYLVDREKAGWETVAKWEEELSLGEQQRLGIARLFFQNPTYAALDECTSAVSQDAEGNIYAEARRRGITTITLSQRLALTEFHTQELKLGLVTDSGWSLDTL
mmetsp:Transcript_19026/g.53668  ORF Transcript_19026/g.53668 Transcript_19026/m.53668 type:complete len:348 (+) Transcript_19026:133-1176(+)